MPIKNILLGFMFNRKKVLLNGRHPQRGKASGGAFYGECGGIGGDYFEWAEEMTFDTHPHYWTYPCDECNLDYVHDGRSCPHCGNNVNTEEVEATA